MEHTRPHQAHAARCRHAAAHREKAHYGAELDTRFVSFQNKFPKASASESLCDFCGRERRRIVAAQSCPGQRPPFRPSTYSAWLRAWRRGHQGADESRQAHRRDVMPPDRFTDAGLHEFLRDDMTGHRSIDQSICGPEVISNLNQGPTQ